MSFEEKLQRKQAKKMLRQQHIQAAISEGYLVIPSKPPKLKKKEPADETLIFVPNNQRITVPCGHRNVSGVQTEHDNETDATPKQ